MNRSMFLPFFFNGWVIQPVLHNSQVITYAYPNIDTAKFIGIEFEEVEQAVIWVKEVSLD